MYVCVCKAVTDHQIRDQVAAGNDSFEAIQFELGVATQCGRCEDCARDVVAQCCSSQPVAALYKEGLPGATGAGCCGQQGAACGCA